MTPASIEIEHVTAGPALDDVRELLREYVRSLSFSLCFQGIDDELRDLPGAYAPPGGALLLCRVGGASAGCVALRPADDGACEMKRLYVRPACRGAGVGRLLAAEIVAAGRRAGYARMVLDTHRSMTPAMTLYESLGFRRIAAYYFNPIEDVEYYELAYSRADS